MFVSRRNGFLVLVVIAMHATIGFTTEKSSSPVTFATAAADDETFFVDETTTLSDDDDDDVETAGKNSTPSETTGGIRRIFEANAAGVPANALGSLMDGVSSSSKKLLENAFDSAASDSMAKTSGDAEENDANGESTANKSSNIQKVAKRKPKMLNLQMTETDLSAMPSASMVDEETQNAVIYDGVNGSDVAWMSRLFNVIHWDADNPPASDRVTKTCASHMARYLKALRNGTIWADKMADASGKYSSQFFFGNDFWLGSKVECRELQNKQYNAFVPPFVAHFFVSKFSLRWVNRAGITYNRLLSIGLCLPIDCTEQDVKQMLERDATAVMSPHLKRSVKVTTVRAVPGKYSLLADKKLHFVLIILSVVIVLTLIGTCYEISSLRRRNCRYKKHLQRMANVINANNNEEGDLKMMGHHLQNDTSIELKLDVEYRTNNDDDDDVVENTGNNTTVVTMRRHRSMAGTSGDNNNTKAMVNAEFIEERKSTLAEIVLSFSALSNSKKILQIGSTPEESLTCVHGLRFLSLAWVIMVHTYLQVFTIAENKALRTLAERNFMFQTVSNATFSVDSFFFISGLLVTYLYFKSARAQNVAKSRMSKNSCCGAGIRKFFKLVGYRFLRLTPAYMFVLLMAEISMRWIHNSSVFEPQSQNHVSCDKYWWRNILYINSLYPMKDMCMLWSWYVSNDTQFYVLGIFILLFSTRYFGWSVFMLFFSLISSWLVTITISLYYDYRAKIEDPFLLFDELYDKPWTRLGPYVVGMFTGWYIFKTKCQLNVSKVTAAILWFLSLFTLISLVYGLHLYPLAAMGSALYVSVGHSAWGAALAWIVIACCSGYGGFVNSFLSYKLLHPLSRLTYCAYLIHPIIMTTTNFQMNAPLHLQDSIVMILYLGNILASFLASFCISLLMEAPVVRLLKIIFSPSSNQPRKSQTNL